jgi:hypothetical protein
MDQQDLREKLMALRQTARALTAMYDSQCDGLLSQASDLKHEAEAAHFDGLHRKAAHHYATIPRQDKKEKDKAHLLLRQAGWKLDECERSYEASLNAKWSQFNKRQEELFDFYNTQLNAWRNAFAKTSDLGSAIDDTTSPKTQTQTMGFAPRGGMTNISGPQSSSQSIGSDTAAAANDNPGSANDLGNRPTRPAQHYHPSTSTSK